MGWNPFKKDDWSKAGNEIEGAFKDGANKAGAAVDDIGDQVKDIVTKELPALLEDALEELQQAVTKEGLRYLRDSLKKANRFLGYRARRNPGLIAAINRVTHSLKFGPAKLTYSHFYDRSHTLIAVLDEYVSKPPRFRRGEIIRLVKALGPDTVNIGVDLGAALLVVKSDAISVAAAWDNISNELFAEIADDVLKALGVPQ